MHQSFLSLDIVGWYGCFIVARKLNNRVNNVHERALIIVFSYCESTPQQPLKQIVNTRLSFVANGHMPVF